MSGGVDSSTAAAMLAAEGHEVIGVGLVFPDLCKNKMQHRAGHGSRRTTAMDDARRAASRIGIPFHALDCGELFERSVVDYFCRSYLDGITPNPCVECNRVVKFGSLLKKAVELGADHVATGHYARVSRDPRTGRYLLGKGADTDKDQSYFLYSLSQEQLSRALFPLGEMTKKETRALARSLGLEFHDKPASQDICFLGKQNYREFLAERFPGLVREGPIVNARGKTLGRHRGIAFYTIGQRKGLGIADIEPLYVLAIDGRTCTIVVGARQELLRKNIAVERVNWIPFEKPSASLDLGVKIRYRQPEARAVVTTSGDDRAQVAFRMPQAAVVPGQSAVFYDGHVVVGGGIIEGRSA